MPTEIIHPFIRKTSWFVGVATLGIATFLAADHFFIEAAIRHRIDENQMTLERISKSLKGHLTEKTEWFHNASFTANKIIHENLTSKKDKNKNRTISDLKLLFESYRGVILQLRFLSKEGREKIRVDLRDDKVMAINRNDLQDKSKRDYFKKAQELKKGEVYVSAIDLNKEKGEIEEPRNVTVRFVNKAFDETGNLQGFIVENFKFPELSTIVSNFSDWKFDSNIRMWNKKLNEHGQIIERQIIASNEHCQLYKNYGPKEEIPYFDRACNVLQTANSVSVKLPLEIKGHQYMLEIYTGKEKIIEQTGNKNISMSISLLSMILMGLSVLMFRVAGWRSKARESEHLRQLNEDLKRESSFVLLLQKAAVSTNESFTAEEALKTCIDLVCDHTGWPVGHFYMPEKDNPNKLLPTDIWHLSNAHDFEAFKKATIETSFNSGEGLPGRVLSNGKPAWITDVTKDPNFPRAKLAKNIGVKAGFAFPVLKGPDVVGVLEFFSLDAMEPDEELLEVMANIGMQLGRVVERKLSKSNLHETKEKLETAYNELKAKQAELISAARLADCGIMASGIAHDFNNILMGIRGNAELAIDESDPDKLSQSLKTIEKLVKEAADLTQRLQFVGKATEPKQEKLEIAEVIESGLRVLKKQFTVKDIELKVNCPSHIPSTVGDGAQLRNVITNLALNAMRAMDDFLAKERAKEENPKMRLMITCNYRNEELIITFSDTGGGISQENLDRIFTPFFTTKKPGSVKGTGLGLAMVLATIKDHDGMIEVDSFTPEMIKNDPGLSGKSPGTTFRIILPVKDLPEETIERPHEEKEIKYPDALIYIVDDEEEIRSLAKDMLLRSGYKNVNIFENGKVALEELNEAVKESSNIPDIIVSDVYMPKMDGLFFCKEVSKIEKSHQPAFVVMSGANTEESIESFKVCGDFVADSIDKPFSMKELKISVEKALDMQKVRNGNQ